jgi:CheY-like chemotaxis protein
VLFPVEDEEEAARCGSQAAAESGNLEGRLRILVVDDDPMVLKLARRMLRNADMEAVIAKEGPEALDALEKSETPIDAVILDRAMPGMSGEEVFRRIREVRPHMPVILSSGFAEEETLKHFNADEHTGFLQKPYQTRQLMDALRKAVGR